MSVLSIFTPTYNRAYCLNDLYQSLLKQTNKSFIWLIMDDGSTDNTAELIKKWQQNNIINIEYYYQDNCGKMIAHNNGVKICKTELFMCLDSDDKITPTAVSEIISYWTKYRNSKKKLLGIIAPKIIIDNKGEVIFTPQIPQTLRYTTGRGLYEHGYKGETAMIFVTEIIKKYPFPVQEGEKFISEVAAYNLMDENYVMITYNNPIMICEYRKDGYSNNILKINIENPKGVVYVNKQKQNHIKRFSPTLMREYIAYSLIAGFTVKHMILDSKYPLLCFMLIPLGYYDMKMIIIRNKKQKNDT